MPPCAFPSSRFLSKTPPQDALVFPKKPPSSPRSFCSFRTSHGLHLSRSFRRSHGLHHAHSRSFRQSHGLHHSRSYRRSHGPHVKVPAIIFSRVVHLTCTIQSAVVSHSLVIAPTNGGINSSLDSHALLVLSIVVASRSLQGFDGSGRRVHHVTSRSDFRLGRLLVPVDLVGHVFQVRGRILGIAHIGPHEGRRRIPGLIVIATVVVGQVLLEQLQAVRRLVSGLVQHLL
ncbi:hypothetical protein GN958_ATG00610 [Phytophthora infestans]|uniref:Uncharacterized protein n=1 Tax=Phytophthora infestans TaxID=4787 RepID=A0A8S9VG70_PHYIN|nr:hypothetical protein GN958_ATG00610 [Phytophthora infestans]